MTRTRTSEEYEAEIDRLHDFTARLAQRLFLAAEVLSIRAERRGVANLTDLGEEEEDNSCPWCEGSGGGDMPRLMCVSCRGTGVRCA